MCNTPLRIPDRSFREQNITHSHRTTQKHKHKHSHRPHFIESVYPSVLRMVIIARPLPSGMVVGCRECELRNERDGRLTGNRNGALPSRAFKLKLNTILLFMCTIPICICMLRCMVEVVCLSCRVYYAHKIQALKIKTTSSRCNITYICIVTYSRVRHESLSS